MNDSSINLDAKRSACQVLSSVWRERGFPVDPMWIAKELGVKVLEAELPENVLGGLVKDADKEPVILLNRFDNADHKRFNCAQKIGHFVDLAMQESDWYRYVDFRVQLADSTEEQVFATHFGESLLMPETEVRYVAESGAAMDEMARYFGVTEVAMEYRLKMLGVDLAEHLVEA